MISNFLVGLILSTVFLLLLVVIELLTRKKDYQKEKTRKLAHILSGLFGLAMAFILETRVFRTFAIIFTLIISTSYLFRWFESIHGVERKTFGEIFLPVGILAVYIIADGATPSFVAAVLILSISDPLAGVFGSLSFFSSAFLILLLVFGPQRILVLALIALVTTIVERISPFGSDNLTIPVGSSLLLRFMLES